MDCSNVKCILLDIEGTTTSIGFVQETLFPYAKNNLSSYLEQNWEKDEVKADVDELKKQASKDKEDGVDGLVPIEDGDNARESVEKNVLWNMSLDRKITPLKQLQGRIWKVGYDKGDIKGHLYSDVAEMLRLWKLGGRRLFIYSSGSVEAQKLLFKNSEAGDLLDLIEGHFDTKIGLKLETGSYKNIAKEIGVSPEEMLFLTDVAKEAEAANEAGLKVAIVIREGNVPLAEEIAQKYHTINSLSDLSIESCAKRAKLSTDEEISKESEKKPESSMEIVQIEEPMDVEIISVKTTLSNKKPQLTEETTTDKTVPKETDDSTEKVKETNSTEMVEDIKLSEKVEETKDEKTDSTEKVKETDTSKNTERVEETDFTKNFDTDSTDKVKETDSIKEADTDPTDKLKETDSIKKVDTDSSEKIKETDADLTEKVKETDSSDKVDTDLAEKAKETVSTEKVNTDLVEKANEAVPTEKVDTDLAKKVEETDSTAMEKETESTKNVSETDKTEKADSAKNGDKTNLSDSVDVKISTEKTDSVSVGEGTDALTESKTNEINNKEASDKLVAASTPEKLKEAQIEETEQKQDKIQKENGAEEWNKENANKIDVNGKCAEVSSNGTASPIIEVAAE